MGPGHVERRKDENPRMDRMIRVTVNGYDFRIMDLGEVQVPDDISKQVIFEDMILGAELVELQPCRNLP